MDDFEFIYNEAFEIKRLQHQEIRKKGIVFALCVIAFLLLQEIGSLILISTGLYDLYLHSTLFQQCYGLLITLIAITVPFFAGSRFIPADGLYDPVPAGRAHNSIQASAAIPAGVALCLTASYVTSYLTLFLESFGIQLSAPDITAPTGGYELFIYFMRITLVAAVIEEVAFRGIVMQSLRKHGDWFAICMSALIFALVHCNLVQAPFAFLAGIVMGYFTIATGSLWVAIAIHFINNGISCLISYASVIYGTEAANSLGNIIIFAAISIGFLCAILFALLRGGLSLPCNQKAYRGSMASLSKGEKLKAFCLNVPMVIAFLAICWYTSFYISL